MKFKINIKKLISHTIALFMVAVMLASVCITTQAKSSTPVSHKYNYATPSDTDQEFFAFLYGDYSHYDEVVAVEKAVDAAYKEMNLEGKDTFYKLLTIYQWVGSHVHYCSSSEISLYDHSELYWTLIEGKGACGEYALLYRFLCINAGINDVECVSGFNGTLPHMWNIVKFNNLWYMVDVSSGAWMDPGAFMTTEWYTRRSDYNTSTFVKNHPMTSSDLDLTKYGVTWDTKRTDDNSINLKVSQTCGSNKITLTWNKPDYAIDYYFMEKHGNMAINLGQYFSLETDKQATTGSGIKDYYTNKDNNSLTLNISEDTSFYMEVVGEYYTHYRSNTVDVKLNSAHTYGTPTTVNATCTTDGYTVKTCTNCGYKQKTTIKATGHTKGVQVGKVNPECTTEGYSIYKCTKCSETFKADFVKAQGHNGYFSSHVNETCTADGYDWYICSSCDEKYKTNYINATGHVYDNGKVTKKATCKATGVKTYTCKNCGVTKTSTIAKSGHTYKNVVTKATLSKNGKIDNKCSVCGKISKTTTINYAKTIKLNRNVITTNGTVQRPTVTVTDSKGKALVYNKDFTVSYSNFNSKNVGRYTVTVKLIGNYSGTKTFPYYINPKPTAFVPSNKGGFKAISKGFTIKWNKQSSQTTGYQIQYTTKRDFSNAATITIANPNTTSYTSKGRAGNTRYYVRVRTYKKIGNGTFYSNWNSGVKSVVTLR